nr:hypothetical protein [uncultured Draconibacterium sp.]
MKSYQHISAPEKELSLFDLLPGDICLTHGNRWLAEKIQHFMQVQGHKWYSVEMWEWYNHMLTIIEPHDNPDKMIIGEAIASGYNLHPMGKYYGADSINRMVVARPTLNFTNYEQARIIERAEYFDAKNIKYEFTNFLWWVPYIYTKGRIDLSPKGEKADDRFFCFESAMELWKYGRGGWIDDEASKLTTTMVQYGVVPGVELYHVLFKKRIQK